MGRHSSNRAADGAQDLLSADLFKGSPAHLVPRCLLLSSSLSFRPIANRCRTLCPSFLTSTTSLPRGADKMTDEGDSRTASASAQEGVPIEIDEVSLKSSSCAFHTPSAHSTTRHPTQIPPLTTECTHLQVSPMCRYWTQLMDKVRVHGDVNVEHSELPNRARSALSRIPIGMSVLQLLIPIFLTAH